MFYLKKELKNLFNKPKLIFSLVLILLVTIFIVGGLVFSIENNKTETETQIKENILEQKNLNDKPKQETRPNPPTNLREEKNLLVWEKYGIKAPIIYASMEDLFEKNSDGTINYKKSVDNNPIDSPIQKKLTKGVVHLPISPLPGEVGNSYIIGHSSNYSNVDSNYNEVFKPIIKKVSTGETFQIINKEGKTLDFKVFEALEVQETNTQEAYKKFEDKKVVTLQGSILENLNGQWLPTKRYLVRAELEIDKS